MLHKNSFSFPISVFPHNWKQVAQIQPPYPYLRVLTHLETCTKSNLPFPCQCSHILENMHKTQAPLPYLSVPTQLKTSCATPSVSFLISVFPHTWCRWCVKEQPSQIMATNISLLICKHRQPWLLSCVCISHNGFYCLNYGTIKTTIYCV